MRLRQYMRGSHIWVQLQTPARVPLRPRCGSVPPMSSSIAITTITLLFTPTVALAATRQHAVNYAKNRSTEDRFAMLLGRLWYFRNTVPVQHVL